MIKKERNCYNTIYRKVNKKDEKKDEEENKWEKIEGDIWCSIAILLKYNEVENMLLISKRIGRRMRETGIDKIMKKRYRDYNYVYKYEPEMAIRIRYYAQLYYENNKSKYNKRLLRTTGVLFEFCIDRKREGLDFLDVKIFRGTKIHKYVWERLITDKSQLEMFTNIKVGKDYSECYNNYVNFFKKLTNIPDYNKELTPGKNIDNMITNGKIKGESASIKEILNKPNIKQIKECIIKHIDKKDECFIYRLLIILLKNHTNKNIEIFTFIFKNITVYDCYDYTCSSLRRYIIKAEYNGSLSNYIDIIKTYNQKFYKILFKCSPELLKSSLGIRTFECNMVNNLDELRYCLHKVDISIFNKLVYNSNISVPLDFFKMYADNYKHYPNDINFAAIKYLINKGYKYDFYPIPSNNSTIYNSG